MRIFGSICAGFMVLGLAAPGHATVALPTTTFSFAGDCTDCYNGNGKGLATLVLSNYTVGSAIMKSNFVSFNYAGTDLLPAFTITSADVQNVSGTMDSPFPAAKTFFISSNSMLFSSQSSGFWCVGFSCLADYGSTHLWSQGSAGVPEPAAWVLMLAGFGAIGVSLRARRTRVSYL